MFKCPSFCICNAQRMSIDLSGFICLESTVFISLLLRLSVCLFSSVTVTVSVCVHECACAHVYVCVLLHVSVHFSLSPHSLVSLNVSLLAPCILLFVSLSVSLPLSLSFLRLTEVDSIRVSVDRWRLWQKSRADLALTRIFLAHDDTYSKTRRKRTRGQP